jgi:hypothetical protein
MSIKTKLELAMAFIFVTFRIFGLNTFESTTIILLFGLFWKNEL